MGDLRDYCGFKIVCLDCGRIIELKDYNNDIFKMKHITVSPIKKGAEIECKCGNFINCWHN